MVVRRGVVVALMSTLVGCDLLETTTPIGPGTGGEDLEVVDHPGGTVGGETWAAGDYHLGGGLSVEGGTLVIEACSILRMPAGAVITVAAGGAIEARGTEACPITITSGAESPSRGDWSGIEIYADAGPGNVLEHVVIEHGGGAGYGGLWLDSGARLAMTDSAVRASGSMGLDLEAGVELAAFAGNTITDNAGYALEISAEDVAELGAGTYGPNDEEGVRVLGGTVTEDGTWADLGVPYRIEDVDVQAALTVGDGAVVEVGSGAVIEVTSGGGLRLAGTAERPVTVRSGAKTPSAGDWGGIWVYGDASSGDNVFEHAVVEHGGGGGYGTLWIEQGASVAVTDSTIRDGEGHGIQVEDGGELRAFEGNTVTGHEEEAIALYADAVDQLGEGTYDVGVRIVGGAVAHDATWTSLGVPYVAPSGFAVETDGGSAHLTLAAGTRLELGSGAGVNVGRNGGLRLDGTAQAPVELTSSASSPGPGDWAEIELYGDSHGGENVFTHAVLRHGGSDGYGALWIDGGAEVTLEAVVFEENAECDVDAWGTVDAIDTTFRTCG